MKDYTEATRREMIEMNYPEAVSEKAFQRWNTLELQRDFTVHSFLAPFVFVTRKADGVKGCMMFTLNPRLYFNFVPDEEKPVKRNPLTSRYSVVIVANGYAINDRKTGERLAFCSSRADAEREAQRLSEKLGEAHASLKPVTE